MSEYQAGGSLGGNALKIGTVPSWNSGREKARGVSKFGVGVEPYTKAIGVVLASSCVEPQS
jgi:hypothetical protein